MRERGSLELIVVGLLFAGFGWFLQNLYDESQMLRKDQGALAVLFAKGQAQNKALAEQVERNRLAIEESDQTRVRVLGLEAEIEILEREIERLLNLLEADQGGRYGRRNPG